MTDGVVTAEDLARLAAAWAATAPEGDSAAATDPDAGTGGRLLSIREIATWVLPMAPEHLRRTLRAHPELPQGRPGAETAGVERGGRMRWFTPAEVARIRSHFAAGGAARWRPAPLRPGAPPVVALAAPLGRAGRTTALLHLATAAALSGRRVLAVDADPAATLTRALGLPPAGAEAETLLALLATAAGAELRRLNAARLDRGDPPLPVDEVAAAPPADPALLVRPTRWPGLGLIPGGPGLMLADLRLGAWRGNLRGWHPWQALAGSLAAVETAEGPADLILVDCGAGLGPFAVSVLLAAEALIVPLPRGDVGQARADLAAGLAGLARAAALAAAEDAATARALGRVAAPPGWARLAILPVREGPRALRRAAPAPAAGVLLPAGLPEVPAVARGEAAQFYDLDPRQMDRARYAALREACEAAWGGVADWLSGPWPGGGGVAPEASGPRGAQTGPSSPVA